MEDLIRENGTRLIVNINDLRRKFSERANGYVDKWFAYFSFNFAIGWSEISSRKSYAWKTRSKTMSPKWTLTMPRRANSMLDSKDRSVTVMWILDVSNPNFLATWCAAKALSQNVCLYYLLWGILFLFLTNVQRCIVYSYTWCFSKSNAWNMINKLKQS